MTDARIVKIDVNENGYRYAEVFAGDKHIFSHSMYDAHMSSFENKETGVIHHEVTLEFAEDEITVEADYVLYPDGLFTLSKIEDNGIVKRTYYVMN